MKKSLLSIALTLLTLPAWSATLKQLENAVVKIVSTPCLLQNPKFEGTGTLVKYQGALYVLTSEHVLIHDSSDQSCHTVDGSRAQLLKVDFAAGLALLKLNNQAPSWQQRALELSQMSLSNSIVGTEAVAIGIPAGTSQIQVLQNGRIQSNRNDRALIPGVKAMLEVAGVPSEYGMSGGLLAATQQSEYKFAGVLSHQVLKRTAGKASTAVDLKPDQVNSNDLTLVIPAIEALQWMSQQITQPQMTPTWMRDKDLQLQGIDSVRTGPLRLKLETEKAQDVWSNVKAVNGGADGSGIGGSGASSKDEEIAVLVVEFAPGASGQEKGKPFQDPLIESWRRELSKGRKVQIVFLKGKSNGQLTTINSVSQFLTQWLRDGNRPLAVVSQDLDASPEQRLLFKRSLEVARMAQDLKNKSSDTHMQAWFELIRNQAVGVQALTVSSDDIAKLLMGPHKEIWETLYSEDFDAAVAFEGAIQNLVTDMKKIGM